MDKTCHIAGMKPLRSALSLSLLVLLSACADPPSMTTSSATRQSDSPVVSLCYSGQTTTRAELADMAMGYCPKGTTGLEVWDHDTFWNDCPISKKNRVTYRCLGG